MKQHGLNRCAVDIIGTVHMSRLHDSGDDRVFAIYTILGWNSPTQGQPNLRKNRLKVAFGPLFPTEVNFLWVRIGFI